MYSMLFYTILMFLLFALILRLAMPILWVLLVAYVIYYIYRLIRYRQFEREVHKAQQDFEKQWQNQTKSQSDYHFSSRTRNDDIIDADFTVKDDNSQ